METVPLRATEAARSLGTATTELLRLAHERRIRYVMIDGIVHFPESALEQWRWEHGG